MGILSTINQTVEDTTSRALDNDRLSVQDTYRGVNARLSGRTEEELKEDTANAWEDQFKGPTLHALQDRVDDDGYTQAALEGTETVSDLTAGWGVNLALGTASGVDTFDDETTEKDGEDIEADFSPDALDTAFGALAAGTGGGGALVKGAGQGSMSGARQVINRLRGRGGQQSTRKTTQNTRNTRPNQGRNAENTRDATPPTGNTNTPTPGGGSDATSQFLRQAGLYTGAGVGIGTAGGIAASEWDAVMGGDSPDTPSGDAPDGYDIAHEYKAEVVAWRVEVTDGDGGILGYLVYLGEVEGDEYHINRNISPEKMSWDNPPQPVWNSEKEADNAYIEFLERMNEGQFDEPWFVPEEEQPEEDPWQETKPVADLDGGWVIFRQKHEESNTRRYIAAATDENNQLIYLAPSTVTSQPYAFESVEDVETAHNGWLERMEDGSAKATPDEGANRPTTGEIENHIRETGPPSGTGGGGGGGLSTIVVAAIGGGLGLLAFILYRVFT